MYSVFDVFVVLIVLWMLRDLLVEKMFIRCVYLLYFSVELKQVFVSDYVLVRLFLLSFLFQKLINMESAVSDLNERTTYMFKLFYSVLSRVGLIFGLVDQTI